MLWQRNIVHALVSSQYVSPAAWSPPPREGCKPVFPIRKRLKVRYRRQVHALTIVGSRGVLPIEENSTDAGIRVSDRGVHQSRLDGSDVRIPEKNAESDCSRTRSSNSTVEYARSDLLSDLARVSVERFALPGKELGKRENTVGVKEELYYNPKVGDFVIGTVTSGSYGKLDIDIGAGKSAQLFRKDAMPLEICNVKELSLALPDDNNCGGVTGPCDGPRYIHDEEILNFGLELPMMAELGTVFTLEVKGLTPAGVAVLSTRSVARSYAWQRIRQLHEHKAILKVKIIESTPAGLVAKIEGLRAYLPYYYLLNLPPESTRGQRFSRKEYVGQIVSVMITSVDEARCNLVISERKAWVAENAYVGALVDGTITDIHTYGLHIRIKNTELSGILHISNISRARIDNIERLFCVGEQVRVMVVPSNIPKKLSFSTADLEMENGLMLRDKEAVYRDAEAIAAEITRAYKKRNSEPSTGSVDDVDEGEQEVVIANWDWLDFGDNTGLGYNPPL